MKEAWPVVRLSRPPRDRRVRPHPGVVVPPEDERSLRTREARVAAADDGVGLGGRVGVAAEHRGGEAGGQVVVAALDRGVRAGTIREPASPTAHERERGIRAVREAAQDGGTGGRREVAPASHARRTEVRCHSGVSAHDDGLLSRGDVPFTPDADGELVGRLALVPAEHRRVNLGRLVGVATGDDGVLPSRETEDPLRRPRRPGLARNPRSPRPPGRGRRSRRCPLPRRRRRTAP